MSDFNQEDGRAGGIGNTGAPEGNRHSDSGEHAPIYASSSGPRGPAFRPDMLEAYQAGGYELIPLHSPDAVDRRGRAIGKAPVGRGWRSAPRLSVEEARAHMASGGNVGVRLRETDLVVDVDPRNFAPGDDPVARLARDLGIDLTGYPTVVTGGGGLHIYMRKPEDAVLRDTLEAYQGIEFKALGRQVVAAGSVHPSAEKPYVWDDDPLAVPLASAPMAPASLIELARRPERIVAADAGARTPEELATMLGGLDATQFREHSDWLQLMMASHHATAGEGRDEWIEWSTSDPEYAQDAWIIGSRWDSLHADTAGKRITEKTLFKALVTAGRSDLLPRTTAEEDFPDDLSETDKPGPVSPLKKFRDEYVWIVDAESFIRRSDKRKFSAQQFKSFNAHLWPEGELLNAVWKDKLPIRKLESLTYEPGAGEFVTGLGGAPLYNLWRDASVKPKPGDVGVFLEHMAYMFPNEVERSYVLDYLAILVQRPADKIHFALLIRGRQGTGKSWIGTLVSRLIGEPNISRPSNAVVQEKYTEWQEGAQLAVIEELTALGRQELSNRLKPVITDEYLCIRPMYGKAYNLPNRLNLLCFTNNADALPIEPGDRRWLVVFSEAQPASEDYYERLFQFLDGNGPAAVAHWLGQRVISLNPKGVAPKTTGKDEMRRLNLSEVEQYLDEMLRERLPPFDFDLVRLEDVEAAIPDRVARQAKNLRGLVTTWLKEEVQALRHPRYTKQDASGRPSSTLWSISNHDHWTGLGAASRADAYMANCVKELT
ncbi:bifunctional DNA primase/polymerase [Caulobacter sp. NIBR1757]|uniref:bifunctional DNA primase/polymerase n=1 Tax=Caulobacter sp. NIBR1757 TaxID=3016000 RepID=UPI0022F0B780|nr:bifunctional DNA primase/polymerase [Caulobacter sp. NIBR1757]WGM37526.1 hypothetical protein AMEJIAPC_00425 [Caulobacter sp. NIBR1757]